MSYILTTVHVCVRVCVYMYLQKGEGIMVKTLDGESDERAKYVPNKRSLHWIKVERMHRRLIERTISLVLRMQIKKDYVKGVADTFDVVPIGAYYGSGRRAGFFGTYLLAVYDEESGHYQSLCKCMTGFTDEFYRRNNEVCSARRCVLCVYVDSKCACENHGRSSKNI